MLHHTCTTYQQLNKIACNNNYVFFISILLFFFILQTNNIIILWGNILIYCKFQTRLRVRKKQVVMPAFFVPSLAGCGKLLLFVPPPGPLRGGGESLRSEKPYSYYNVSVGIC